MVNGQLSMVNGQLLMKDTGNGFAAVFAFVTLHALGTADISHAFD